MRNEIQLSQVQNLPAAPEEPWYQTPPAGDGGGSGDQPLKRMHRLLRGRYWLAINLAVLFGVVGAAVGYLTQKPQWRSVALLEINPIITNVGGSQDWVQPMWEQFVRSQQAMLMSQDVLIDAMKSDDWRNTGHGMTAAEMSKFSEKLDVTYLPGTSLLRVTYTDKDKNLAPIATRAVIQSYLRKFANQDQGDLTQKINYNDQQRRQLDRALRDKQDIINQFNTTLGTDTPEQYVDQQLMALNRLREQYDQAEIQYEIASQQLKAGQPAPGATSRPAELSVDQMAQVDSRMQQLLVQRDEAERRLSSLIQGGLGANHPDVKKADALVQSIDKDVQQRKAVFQKIYKGVVPGMNGQPAVTPQLVENLKIQLDILKDHVAKKEAETKDLGRQRSIIASTRLDIESLKKEIKGYEDAIDRLTAQQSFSNKIRVVSYGDTPFVPAFDRRMQFAALGLFGGAAAPVAILLLIGLLDQRYRYSDDAGSDMSGITLLGILPNLPDLLTDPDQAAIAAHCVHQIRTMLQINGTEERRVFSVTSASPGDGKTSLTLALGLSFAASGSRTLLIDCDLIGGGLTARLNMVTPEGVLEAINNHALLEYVRTTDIADLSMLPVGDAHAHHASSLSPAALRRLVTEARKHFDTVLIDTGPVLGSIEASSVCAASDGVILVVARGQQRPLVEKALGHLRAIGARLAGVVFNRAQSRDFDRSVNRLSIARSVQRTSGHGAGTGLVRTNGAKSARTKGDGAHFGPVAKAVASTFKAPRGSDYGSDYTGGEHTNGHGNGQG
jgi:capsular exopolysaccharide synthesis family protein